MATLRAAQQRLRDPQRRRRLLHPPPEAPQLLPCWYPSSAFLWLLGGRKSVLSPFIIITGLLQPIVIPLSGDVLSHHLAEMLELGSVPCVMLEKVEAGSVRWAAPDLDALHWAEGDPVAFIQWLPATKK